MNDFIKITVDNYFNHKLIAHDDIIKINTSLEHKGIYDCFFNPEMLPASLEEIHITGIPFIFPDKSNEKYDNITCEEQIIKLPLNYYKQVHFLGLCEFYNYKENIKVAFSEEYYEECPIFLKAWDNNLPTTWNYDIDRQYSCLSALKALITIGTTCNIFCTKTPIINTHHKINSIILPFNPNMHIFAITLEKQVR